MTISHHLLRRTARAKKARLDNLVALARQTGDTNAKLRARNTLAKYGVTRYEPKPVFEVLPARRGPWRYRVELA